ncbi:MAG TPA: UvrD-helicase domain-containing protein [Actinomycetes bacterium]|nr:UvrD-helicase domain-containing protein [Actinomycetes bacterium]
MPFYADLHIHSKYSRACSRDCDLEHLAWWARRKGLSVVGTGDFTHPVWFETLRSTLVPAEPGLYRLPDDVERAVSQRLPPSCHGPVRFLLSVEIATIYKRAERTRKLHHLVYMPDLDAAAAFNRSLGRIGNLASDGRPILGLDSRDLLDITLQSGDGAYLVPAHAWTPWFGILGSKSGFDSVEECFGDLTGHVFALETGLSSDPAMNWRVSSLDRYRLVSNSDAHSPPALAREASVFGTELDYFALRRALETGEGFGGTVEFFPEEGKYHLDGHRNCGVCQEPAETRRRGERCPVCGKPLTIGVLHRVEVLADRSDGARPPGAAGFRCLVPLPEILGELLGVGPRSKAVGQEVAALVERLGPELGILQDVPLEEIGRSGPPLLAEAIGRLRRGAVVREAGYDGEYGVIRLFDPAELRGHGSLTATLFDPPDPVQSPPARAAAGLEPTEETAGLEPTEEAAGPPPSGRSAGPEPTERSAGPPPSGRSAGPPPTEEVVETPDGSGVEPPQLAGVDAAGVVTTVLGGLDPDQRAAAATVEGPLLIVAGPGTGKTRTLTHRIAHLVGDHGVPPERCLAITFTRRACEELHERLRALLPDAAERVLVTTFHGLGLQIVREQRELLGLEEGVGIADESERLELVREVSGGSERDARRLLDALSRAKRARAAGPGQGPGPGSRPGSEAGELADRLAGYDRALRERGLLDFDDLLTLPVALLGADPDLARSYRDRWPSISVDEYQDVDELQYRLLCLLTGPDGHLCAIGDPDQAIYGFRGADVGFFLRFGQDFPAARTVRLTRNYRSSRAIVDGALQAIAPSTLVRGRVLAAHGEAAASAPRIVVQQAATEQGEADLVVRTIDELLGGSSFYSIDSGRAGAGGHGHGGLSFADVAVLYRTDAQAGPLAEALARAGMPFQKRSHDRLTDRPGVRAVIALLRVQAAAAGPGDPDRPSVPVPVLTRVHRAVKAAVDALGPTPEPDAEADVRTAMDLLTPLAERCGEDLGRFLADLALGAEVDALDPRADRVSLLTLHAAKGLEFPVVFLTGCEDGLLPLRWGRTGDLDLGEERRLFFVGMTRARSHLYLTRASRRTRHGTIREATPSPFLSDITETLLERVHAAARSPRRPATPAGDQLQLL